jgi:hypothetical protein
MATAGGLFHHNASLPVFSSCHRCAIADIVQAGGGVVPAAGVTNEGVAMIPRILLPALALFAVGLAGAAESANDPREEASIFGICSSAESGNDCTRWLPIVGEAGVRWTRLWPGWHSIESTQGAFDWKQCDERLALAKANNMKALGTFVFFPKWASSGGDHWTCPPKDMAFWSTYVSESVKRYQGDVKYWEIWNEFNAGFSKSKDKPKDYADLVKAASIAAKAVDPEAKIGMSCANFDLNFFDQSIKAGAAGHFDFICVHPYENLGEVAKGGGEPGYLSMSASLRKLLADNGQNADMPLWITEIGYQAPTKPEPVVDARQADTLVKCFVLSAAAGFKVVTWFEVRGPDYGKGTDLGFIRKDWSERPALPAFRQLSQTIGVRPEYVGWLNLAGKGYGFVFNNGSEPVLCAWAPTDEGLEVSFDSAVSIAPVNGQAQAVAAKSAFHFTRGLHYVSGISRALVAEAVANKAKPFPWGGDFTGAKSVRCLMGANVEEGIRPTDANTFTVVNDLTSTSVKTIGADGKIPGHIPFRVHHTFLTDMPRRLRITLVAKRLDQSQVPKPFVWFYESLKGYRPPTDKTWEIPAGEDWQEHSWEVDDANFAGQWGYNFTFGTGEGKKVPFLIKEVRVDRLGD